jgi:hypothetical protein
VHVHALRIAFGTIISSAILEVANQFLLRGIDGDDRCWACAAMTFESMYSNWAFRSGFASPFPNDQSSRPVPTRLKKTSSRRTPRRSWSRRRVCRIRASVRACGLRPMSIGRRSGLATAYAKEVRIIDKVALVMSAITWKRSSLGAFRMSTIAV